MRKNIIKSFILAFILMLNTVFLVSFPVADYGFTENWIIDGNTVYVNDSLVFASATPHTVHGTDEVVFEFESKVFTGDVDFAWGFNQNIMIPTNIWLWQNYSHENYYYEEQEFYGCVDLYNVTGYVALGIENYSNYSVFLGNSNNSYLYEVNQSHLNNSRVFAFSDVTNHGSGHWELCGNYDQSVKIWDNQTFFDWKTWDVEYTHVEWNYENMTDWYITPAQGIVEDTLYKAKIRLERINWSLKTVSGKYWFAFKPSSETLSESISNGHFYCLDPWYDSSWTYKKKITIDHSHVTSTLSNFPVLINITDTDLRDKAQSDGDDICFVNSAENTQLKHEIEYWNSSTGELYAWVKIPTLSSSVDTDLYMYYDNDACGSQEDAENVWDSNYMAVWHFNDGSWLDSTSNDIDLSAHGDPTNIDTRTGKGVYLDGNDYLYHTTFLDDEQDDLTFDYFIKATGATSSEYWHVGKQNAGSSTGVYVQLGNVGEDVQDRLKLQNYASPYTSTTVTDCFEQDVWYYKGLVYDENDYAWFFLDQATTNNVSVTDRWFQGTTTNFCIGSFDGGSCLIGHMDELRISDVPRTLGWIDTTYNTVTNGNDGGFFSISSEIFGNLEPVFSNPVPASNAVNQSLEFTWNITINDPEGDSFNWSIECAGLSNSDTEASNGSKLLNLTGLSYCTNYTVFVNATDSGSNLWNNETFYFTTMDTSPPNVSNPIPADTTISVSIEPTLSIDIISPDGFDVFVVFYDDSDDSVIGNDTVVNGTADVIWTGLIQNTTYSWYVNASYYLVPADSNYTVSSVYSFKTIDVDTLNNENFTLTEGYSNISVFNTGWVGGENSTNTYLVYKTGGYPSNTGDGTSLNVSNDAISHLISGLNGDTTYYFKVWGYNVTDNLFSIDTITDTSTTYTNCPQNFVVSTVNDTKIDLSWVRPSGSDSTLIRYNDTSYPVSITDGAFLYNGSGSSTSATGLNSDTTYYFTAWSWGNTKGAYSQYNVTGNSTTVIPPNNPTGFTSELVGSIEIDLDWNIDGTIDKTKVVRKVDSCPASITDGTVVYFDTLTSFDDTGLDYSVHYYYCAWGFRDDYDVYSYSCVNTSEWTRPQIPQNVSSETINVGNVNVSWDNGIGADTYLVRKKTGGYPSSINDGSLMQNSSVLFYNDTSYSADEFFSIWSFNTSSGLFSIQYNVTMGSLTINAYKETDPSVNITNYTVEIVNPSGSESYVKNNCNNPLVIDIDDVPHGSDIIIRVSKDGYYSRNKEYDIDANSEYNINFYLAPDGDGGGTEGDDDYIPPADEEDVLKTTSHSVSNPAVNLSITLECEPSLITLVRGYNESLYGHWFNIPNDKYTLTGNVVEVDASVLDENTSLVEVQYYCDNTENYAQQYLVTVLDVADNPVASALINVKVYVNTTDTWETIYIVYSDGSGESDFYLVPGTLYKLTISKDGYQTEIADWYPSESKYTKEFTLLFEDTDIEDLPMGNYVTATAEFTDTDDITTNFTCTYGEIYNSTIYVYDTNISTGNETLLESYNYTTDLDWSYITADVNTSHSFRIVIYFNSSVWGFQKITILINPDYTPPTTQDDTDDLFDLNYGTNPLGWSNFLLWIFMVLLFIKADKEDSGIVLVIIGVLQLVVSALTGFNTVLSAFAGGIIPILCIVVGIMHSWNQKRVRG